MLTINFLHSVEFYVILLVIAALAVGLLATPAGHGPVETDFTTAKLKFDPELRDLTPRLEVDCSPDGTVKITRIGLPEGLDSSATVAIAITRKAFDLTLEERITPDSRPILQSETEPVNCAVFYLTGLAHERYHIKFNSDATSSFVAFSLNNLPGISSTRPLLQA